MLFTFPSRYWFTIGQRLVFSLGRWSSRIPTRFHVPGGTRGHPRVTQGFGYGAITHYGRTFQTALLPIINPTSGPHNPHTTEVVQVWAMSDFARHYFRNRDCFLFLQVLRWFTSLGSLRPTYGFSGRYAGFTSVGFPIRRSSDQRVLPPPRGLSQVATSFFAVWRQGIHRTPLVA